MTLATTNKIIILPIEPLENRYTGHWYQYIPKQLQDRFKDREVVSVGGYPLTNSTDPGAFFNFSSTSAYKATQIASVARMFSEGEVSDGDMFLVTDAWNPCAHMVRYMAEIAGISIQMVGIWHAGAYDPHDIIATKFKSRNWASSLEVSLRNLFDLNVFATEYHKQLFENTHGVFNNDKWIVCGFPMEYCDTIMPVTNKYHTFTKKNIIVFPHRKSPEKNLKVFEELSELMPEYEFVVAQDVCNNKDEYHDLLSSAKFVFSASMQETLGIGMAEGVFFGAIPIVPNMLSYDEMYSDKFKYCPYGPNMPKLVEHIRSLENTTHQEMRFEALSIYTRFFCGYKLYSALDALMKKDSEKMC